jgi:ubiquitin carboxyl-terminal hydrolase 1
MSIPEEFRAWCLSISSVQVLQQILPLLVLLLIPVLVLTLATAANGNPVFYSIAMILENLALPWNWSNGHSTSPSTHQRKKSKKSHVRTRVELAQNGTAKHGPYVCCQAVYN